MPIRRYTVVRRNLEGSFPAGTKIERQAIARGAYASLGATVFEMLGARGLSRMSEAALDDLITITGFDHLEAALARGRGVILVTAHTGGFDLMACACARRVPALHVVTTRFTAPGLDAWWQQTRTALGVHLHDPRDSLRDVLAALRQGGCVAMMIDQRVYVCHGGVAVPFLGRLAETSLAPAVLAARAGCPVIPTRCIREADGRHRVVLEPAIDPPSRHREDWIALTVALTARVEAWVRDAPEQWLWLHDRWRATPGGGNGVIGPAVARALRGDRRRAINRLKR